jgi:perosamine synthetase
MTRDLPQRISDAILSVVSLPDNEALPLHSPVFDELDEQYIKSCIKSTYVSSVGPFVDEFETSVAAYTGSTFAVAVSSGTAGLHAALLIAGVKPLDEVIVPPLTFAATGNAVSYCGATPIFIDVEMETFGLCPKKLRSFFETKTFMKKGECFNKDGGNRIAAVVPVHVFGHPCKIVELVEIAREFNVCIIEDAAEGLGSSFRGVKLGTFGDLGIISFNGNKIITTGGGGIILTNDENTYNQLKHITTTAKVPHKWRYFHDKLGYNYRMPNLNAALGCAQLSKIDKFVKEKRALFFEYETAFSGIEEISIFREPAEACSNYWLQTLILSGEKIDNRDQILFELNKAGLLARPAWDLLNNFKYLGGKIGSELNVAHHLQKSIINIPSGANLRRRQK